LILDQEIGVRVPTPESFNFKFVILDFGLHKSAFRNPQSAINMWHEISLNVRYAETDQMGVVHHANYLIWFELGRTEYCKAKGFSYRDLEREEDALMVVAEIYCRYKSPAFYDDAIVVRTKLEELRSRSLRFVYEIFRPLDETILVEGESLHIFTDRNKRVRSLPMKYRELLGKEFPAVDENAFPLDQAPS
jgi:acyl-CoA thioester hydrolase